jgi:hypothetical protein
MAADIARWAADNNDLKERQRLPRKQESWRKIGLKPSKDKDWIAA